MTTAKVNSKSMEKFGKIFHPLADRCLQRAKAVAVVLGICLLPSFTSVPAHADPSKPVTIACDWDFPPYEYIDGKGKSSGFCIDVLHTILTDLDIRHEFVMGARQKAIDSFYSHNADLIIDYGNRFTDSIYHPSVNILGYYNIVLARNRNTRPVSLVSQINGDIVAVNTINDSLPYPVIIRFSDRATLQSYAAREALGVLENDKSTHHLDYFLWGQEVLRWKIKEYNLHNVVTDSIDIPPIEIRVVGYDKELIEDIDNQYARLQQSGKIKLIRDKWFHPDFSRQHTSPIVWYVVLAVLLASLFLLAMLRFTRFRIRKAIERNNITEAMMRQALSMGNFTVITNNLRHNLVTNQHGHSVPDEGITMQQMLEYIHPDDRDAMITRRETVRKLKGKPYPYRMRWNEGTAENPDWHTITGFSYPEMGHLPIPKNIVIISRDITEKLQLEQEASELTNRYMKMFESSLIAMSFYDKDGHLINLNENMKKLCGLDDEKLKFFWNTNLFDTNTFSEVNPTSNENFHTCSHMYFPDMGLDKYVEQRLRPIRDENGELIYYAITARDVTEERTMYLELQRQRKALDETNKANLRYERELRTLLENCNMYVFHVDVEVGLITFSRSLHGDQFTMTFDDYINGIDVNTREEAQRNMQAVLRSDKPFNITRLFNRTSVNDKPAWFAISGMPLMDPDGKLKALFGVVRNITDLMKAQDLLREETVRAENSTMLKAAFLANMTHEIRTPLNAIVGFSDLLQTVSDPADRKEFISIIHNNCDMLMRLINDIFETSSLDIKPLAIVPRRVDFAKEFAIICQSLSQRVQEPAVQFIAENPTDSFVTDIDMERIQQVITNFVTNAVKYTHEGHIRVGWAYQTPPQPPQSSLHGLYIFCEDTGTGIPKEKQAHVFDRFVKLNDFVQGTGLGLAISKSIAQGCGGRIGLESEGEGHGCTFWIWIPCPPPK
mgnify:CR=1 FL=1